MSSQMGPVRKKFAGSEDQLRLRHFGRLFAVSRRDGTIRCLTDGAPASYNEAMNIYTL